MPLHRALQFRILLRCDNGLEVASSKREIEHGSTESLAGLSVNPAAEKGGKSIGGRIFSLVILEVSNCPVDQLLAFFLLCKEKFYNVLPV
mmetsp:Transcript_142581/g.251841  ORF Transcript_142581/g.251841 Transcript_142581/m.251841 type:complete len:90 (-) Transcript_142581:82-351(-)